MAEAHANYFQGEKIDARLIKKLIDQTENFDPDERYMGISDLGTLMETHDVITNFGAYQESIQQAILKRLDDNSNDVQSMACRTITTLIEKFQHDQVKKIAEKLVSLSTSSNKPEMRSVYAIGLETCVKSLGDNKLGIEIADIIAVPRLIKTLTKPGEYDSSVDKDEARRIEREKKRVLLELLKLFLEIYGPWLENQWDASLNCLLLHLKSDDEDIRNKSMTVMGALVACVPDEIFEKVMDYTITELNKSSDTRNETIRLVSIISRQAGVRIGGHLDKIVPILQNFCSAEEKQGSDVEVCLQAFETMFLRCPSKLDGQVDDMVQLCLTLMTWDPFYTYQEEEDMKDDVVDEWGEDDEWGDEGDDAWADGGDDDEGLVVLEMGEEDTENTWKVRKASLRCLQAFINSRPQDRKRYFEQILLGLQSHFKERDDRVKTELFITASTLVRTCALEVESPIKVGSSNYISIPVFKPHATLANVLSNHISTFTAEVVTQLGKTKEPSVRLQIIILVRNLVLVSTARDTNADSMDASASNSMVEHFDTLIPVLQECMADKDIRLKQDTLDLIQKLICLHEPSVTENFSEVLANRIIDALGESANSILTAAMNTARIFYSILHDAMPFNEAKQTEGVISMLYEPIAAQLQVQDIDRSAKAAAILAAAMAITNFADVLQSDIEPFLAVVADRLENEVAVIPCLRSIRELCGSSHTIDISSLAARIMNIIVSFLYKQAHNIRHEAAETLNSLVKQLGNNNDAAIVEQVLKVVKGSNLIRDEDCRLSELLFYLFTSMLENIDGSYDLLMKFVLTDQLQKFLQSPLVRGYVLEAMCKFLAALQKRGTQNDYKQLKAAFLDVLNPSLSDQSFVAVSRCMAAITLQMPSEFITASVDEFASTIKSSDPILIRISLLCVGEIGAVRPLTDHEDIESLVLNAFKNSSERVKSTAARALGLMAVGNIAKYVPFMLTHLKKGDPLEYLLINSLRETIAEAEKKKDSQAFLGPHINTMSPLLFQSADSKDEGVRTVVGECLGRLAFIDGSPVFNGISQRIKPPGDCGGQEGENVRGTMATAIKFAVQTQKQLPPEVVETLFECLQNENDILPRRSIMLCFNTIANIRRDLIEPDIHTLIKQVYPYCETNKSLIKQFELGPFKHKVDNGLPLRKATFQVMDSLQRVFAYRLNIADYCENLRHGFSDGNEDVQMLAFTILSQLAENQPNQLVPCLNSLKDNMLAGVKAKLKMAKGKGADAERSKDVLKVIVKSLCRCMDIDGVEAANAFCTLYKRVAKTKLLADMIKELQTQ